MALEMLLTLSSEKGTKQKSKNQRSPRNDPFISNASTYDDEAK